MQKFYTYIRATKFWQWFTKPRSKVKRGVLIGVALFLLLIYIPKIDLIVDLFALAIGAMGVLSSEKQGTQDD